MKNSENEIVPRKYKGGEEDLWRVSKFVGKKGKREESEEDKENIPTPPTKKRRSERAKIITPDKRDKVMAALLSGQPRDGDVKWTKESLITAIQNWRARVR